MTTTGEAPAATGDPAVDWDRAGRWGGRLASPGPTAPRAELARLVADLHDAAQRARPLALRAGRLTAAVEAAGNTLTVPQVLVVDRAGWAAGAAQSFAGLSAGSTGEAAGGVPTHRDAAPSPRHRDPTDRGTVTADGVRRAVEAAPGTAQAAALLGLLAGRVLGQFDPFAVSAPAGGRLLLVAPNVLRTERALSAVPADFRLWVCVHEQTHALQFAAAPWLAEHLKRELAALLADLTEAPPAPSPAAVLRSSLRRGTDGGPAGRDDLGLLGLALGPEQRERVDRVSAVLALLEGHADVTMDAVNRRAIPTAKQLRARFEVRRRRGNAADRLLRRALGMEAKLAQYREGAAFVRGVRRTAGRTALEPVWSGPEMLPTPPEISDPTAWVRRVHG